MGSKQPLATETFPEDKIHILHYRPLRPICSAFVAREAA